MEKKPKNPPKQRVEEQRTQKGQGQIRHAVQKTALAKLWHFLWHDDSFLSLIASMLVVFLLGRYLLFPLIGLIVGTSYPVVAVLSDSMNHHKESFELWWNKNKNFYENYNITKEQFQTFRLKNGFSKSDILLVKGFNPKKVKIGEVLLFKSTYRPEPIVHRLIIKQENNNQYSFTTKGDANAQILSFEKDLEPNRIKGIVVAKIPYLGWPRIWMSNLINAIRRK